MSPSDPEDSWPYIEGPVVVVDGEVAAIFSWMLSKPEVLRELPDDDPHLNRCIEGIHRAGTGHRELKDLMDRIRSKSREYRESLEAADNGVMVQLSCSQDADGGFTCRSEELPAGSSTPVTTGSSGSTGGHS